MIYTDINSLTGDIQLRFVLSGPNVRVTRLVVDPFDSDDDHEELLGDFRLDSLRARLDLLGTPTATVAVQKSRPARRKPRRWWTR